MSFYGILKTLNPFPGASYSRKSTENIVSEASIHIIDGEIVIDINKSQIPPLRISDDFRELEKTPDKTAKSYVTNQIKDAQNFIDSVELRYKTLTKVLEKLTVKQRDYFLNGPKYLKVLTMKEIAEELNLADSTVSRLAASKWIDTDWGLKPIKYFFSSGVKQGDAGKTYINTDSGRAAETITIPAKNRATDAITNSESNAPVTEALSKNAVKELIADIIKEYGKISDQKISDKLAEQGIKCARRTVNKYRTEMGV